MMVFSKVGDSHVWMYSERFCVELKVKPVLPFFVVVNPQFFPTVESQFSVLQKFAFPRTIPMPAESPLWFLPLETQKLWVQLNTALKLKQNSNSKLATFFIWTVCVILPCNRLEKQSLTSTSHWWHTAALATAPTKSSRHPSVDVDLSSASHGLTSTAHRIQVETCLDVAPAQALLQAAL